MDAGGGFCNRFCGKNAKKFLPGVEKVFRAGYITAIGKMQTIFRETLIVMKLLRHIILLILIAAAGLPAVRSEELAEQDKLRTIAKLTARVLSRSHFRKQAQNAAFSAKVFDQYIQLLDPAKTYFTAADIAVLEKDRFYLLDQIGNGKLDAVYKIYRRYLERLAQYRAFAEAALTKGFDFTVEESFRIDRKDAEFCANDEELKELWRKKIKNDLLYFRLMRRVMEERAASDPEVAENLKKRWNLKSPEDKIRTRLHDIANQATQADSMDILGMFLTALAQSYGPHSHYSTPKQDEDFDIQFKLSLTGIGATLTSEDGYTKVVELVPNGPAAKDGRLKPEDRIIAVAQEDGVPLDVIDMPVNQVVKYVRGPVNTKVTLTVLAADKGANALPEEITIVRDRVQLTESAAKGEIKAVLGPDGRKRSIGVITLNSFYMDFEAASKGEPDYRSCTRDIARILADFQKKKVDGVLLDLRSNSGGSLLEAITLSGLFIKSGPVVQIVNSAREADVQYDPDPELAYGGPLVLLTSKFSASSAEILTGAMIDHRRAPVLGDTRTYGKGTVLEVSKLARRLSWLYRKFEAGSITFETAMFYRVNGDSNQQRGVPSDIVLPSFTEEMEVGELFNPNHLPWNRIEPVEQERAKAADMGYVPVTKAVLEALKAHSAKRFAADPARRKFLAEIARFRKMRDRRDVSLNEARRLKEYRDEKAADDAMEAALDASEKNGRKNRSDMVLEEALTIAADYVAMLEKGRADGSR